ncbi:site-specific DNA-methyltransferase [Fluviispira sanaruensis]|uniref:site-specific DNA-methyltransferase (adenine-specific) n=1 Tax=Fluviispira sanaruensis TaxID=2493639 RepID=A0A4P2VS10_FLUSA|nr:site-specific DNA-methyltransferase [Fluviispira sanaruensis]BBH52025.1 hypothetical protein JCM31447_04620 [Fluviispira sanaruensis]
MNDFFWDFYSNEKVILSEVLNSVIVGDNLFVLEKLNKYYANKIKLIYIDPPYNTKKKFVYNDNFGSHQHWSQMMKLRLEIAYKLLKEDGFIFISIDDNEVHYLRMLMDSIFGEENFRNCIVVPRGIKNVQSQFSTSQKITIGHEYLLFYSKNKNIKIKKFEFDRKELRKGIWNNHWRGTERPNLRYELFGIIPKKGQWRWSKERSEKAVENYHLMFQDLKKIFCNLLMEDLFLKQELIDNWYMENTSHGKKIDLLRLNKNNKPEHYISPSYKRMGNDVWFDIKCTGSYDLRKIIPEAHFDMPKPIDLIKRIVNLITNPLENDIILDFFAGSGTTGQAVFQQNMEDKGNRKVILVQLFKKIEGLSQYEIHSLAELAYKRLDLFIKKNNLDCSFKFLQS